MIKGTRIRIKPDWEDGGKLGTIIGDDVFIEQWWTPVKMDDEDDPNWHKTAGLEYLKEIWTSLPNDIPKPHKNKEE